MLFSNIYTITNKINNKKYVGQTIDTEKRWKEHQYNAKNNLYPTIYLYNAMKKYGLENFTFEVIESDIPLEEINAREEYWIEKLNTLRPNGYNLTLGGEGTKGYKMLKKTKELISTKAKERFNSMTEEEKQEMINRLPKTGGDLDKMNKGFQVWLKNSPEEAQERIRKSVITKKEKGYDFYNFSFGRMTDNEKQEMYEKISLNNPRRQPVIMCNLNDKALKEFHSIGEASRFLNKEFNIGLHSKNRIRRVLDSNNTAYGYKWRRK